MPRRNSRTRTGMAVAAALALCDASAAGAAKLEGLRLIPGQAAATEGDAYQRGRALLIINDLPGALAAFRQSLTEQPQSLDTLNGIAVCYDRLGRYDLSRTYYETALAIAPDAPVVLNNFGYSLYLQGNYAQAIDRLVAARNGPDAQSSAAAARTLALIAAMPRAEDAGLAEAPPAETVTASARIEQISEGEQRLVFGTGARPAAVQQAASAAGAGPARQVAAAAGHASENAARPIRHDEAVRPPFVDHPADAPVQVVQAVAGNDGPRQPAFPVQREAVPPLMLVTAVRPDTAADENPLPVLARRDESLFVAFGAQKPLPGRSDTATGTLPVLPVPAAQVFVSDDARLNAFAARMQVFRRDFATVVPVLPARAASL